MYVESELISKCGKINLMKNQKLTTSLYNKSSNITTNQFDDASKKSLQKKYQLHEKKIIYPLSLSPKKEDLKESILAETFDNIGKNLNKLLDLDEKMADCNELLKADSISKYSRLDRLQKNMKSHIANSEKLFGVSTNLVTLILELLLYN